MRAIVVNETGGSEVLTWTEVDDLTPGSGEVLVEAAAAGVNFIDTYHRSGLYPVALPFIPGNEGAGVISAVGPETAGFATGDIVAWSGVNGSYAEQVLVPVTRAVLVPDGMGVELAAAVMLQGMTAHFLACSTFPLEPGHRCLIHAAAGGVGLLLTQIAKKRGAEVFATVGTAEKGELAARAGADHIINYREVDFGDAVEGIAGQRPLDVVFDGVGADTFAGGLDLLRPRGMMITFGNASGPVEPVLPLDLMRGGSLFLTRPTLGAYTATREDLEVRANDLFAWMADGSLDVRIGTRVPLAEAKSAHDQLEGRSTAGKVLLIP